MIADVASIIVSRGTALEERAQPGSGVPVCITLDVPSFHYYQSIEDKLERRSCTANEALQWVGAIEQRYDQVSTVFERSVRHELVRRGVTPPYDCEIRVSPRINLVASLIHQALQAGRSPSLDDVLDQLNNQSDGLWRDFFKLVPPKERPQNFRALGYLFYVFQAIRPALTKNAVPLTPDSSSASDCSGPSPQSSFFGEPAFMEQNSKSRRLLISVDDGAERRIYSRAQKFLKKIRASPDFSTNPTLVETYLCQRVFIPRRSGST